jgi:glutathione S-transferase
MTHPQPQLTLCELDETGLPDLESYSPFCLKVHRALLVHGLRYTSRRGSPRDFRNLNRAGQVPILLIDGQALPDSTLILARLEALSVRPLHAGLPPGVVAEALLWEDYADTALNGFVVAARWADPANWPAVKDAYFHKMPALIRAIVPGLLRRKVRKALWARDVTRHGLDAAWARLEVILDQLERRAPVEGFWLGPTLTAADLALFGQLHSLRTPLTPMQGAMVDRRRRLAAYLDRVHRATRRPADARLTPWPPTNRAVLQPALS